MPSRKRLNVTVDVGPNLRRCLDVARQTDRVMKLLPANSKERALLRRKGSALVASLLRELRSQMPKERHH